ncbi:unnamed protein product [Acanthoscelides obtectus]|uniref:Uncharacterized protein n=1 Tax=Acanthoscelides obtectus TaxID=200917 RepID=A0A9P0KMZ2_ACAOB|nr:unnamed protein product [Acanthoscelides obtectus]CAK1654751.1 hypothetical protein AOBTE_LOCUS18814 [Acanthoscelides obtectus]
MDNADFLDYKFVAEQLPIRQLRKFDTGENVNFTAIKEAMVKKDVPQLFLKASHLADQYNILSLKRNTLEVLKQSKFKESTNMLWVMAKHYRQNVGFENQCCYVDNHCDNQTNGDLWICGLGHQISRDNHTGTAKPATSTACLSIWCYANNTNENNGSDAEPLGIYLEQVALATMNSYRKMHSKIRTLPKHISEAKFSHRVPVRLTSLCEQKLEPISSIALHISDLITVLNAIPAILA